jgi:dUTP pyrophosphatase
VKLLIHRVRPDALLPKYATAASSGLDLHAHLDGTNNGVIFAGSRVTFPTGIAVAIPDGFEGQVRARSGLARDAGVVAVSGTIDADYRGEIHITLINHGASAYRVKQGDRIAQFCVAPVMRVELEEVGDVGELGETERGERGFGSTGNQ